MLFTRLCVVPKIISPERLGGALKEALAKHTNLSKVKTDRAIKKAIVKVWSKIIKLTPVGNPNLWLYNHPQRGYIDYVGYLGKPVGYVGGRARNNWFIGTIPGQETTKSTAFKGAQYVQKSLPKQIIGTSLYLYNNLPYINKLEFGGHSQQAPKGMVRVSLLGWRKELQKQFKMEQSK